MPFEKPLCARVVRSCCEAHLQSCSRPLHATQAIRSGSPQAGSAHVADTIHLLKPCGLVGFRVQGYYRARAQLVVRMPVDALQSLDAAGRAAQRVQHPGGGRRVWGFRAFLARAQVVVRTPVGALQIITPLVGRHNVYNILAAVAVGLAVTVDGEPIPLKARAPALLGFECSLGVLCAQLHPPASRGCGGIAPTCQCAW